MKHKVLVFTFLYAIFFLIAPITLAQYTYTPMEKIPGTTENISAFPDYIKAIYKFALWSVGIAALLMVSVGGFMYFSAAGNTSKLDKAKIVIRDSIFGITAVLTAYLLLYTINPDLVGVSLSGLSNLGNSANASVSFQSASPSQGTANYPFQTSITITGNGSYTLESLTISGMDSSNYTSSLSNNTITVVVHNPPMGTHQITATILDQDNNSHTSENLNFKIISDSSQLAVTNLGLNEGIVGDNYSQTIQAEGGSHNYTISVSGLPDGLTFNSGSNTITGTPAQAGTYPITITVNDGTNNPIEKEFTLSVREGNYPVPPENCIDPCEDGDTKCTAGGYIQYCELHNTCRVWGSPHACPEGESCLNGVCGTGGVFAGNFTCDPNSPVQDNNPNWNCPFSMCHHSYCAVCEEDDANMDGTAGCDEGEGWCSGSWHCAEGLVCSPASHVCVNPENTYNNEEEHPGITLTKSDTYRKFNFRAGEVKLFKFKADSGPSNPTLTVVAEVQSHYSHGDLQMMIKYAGQDWQTGPPTESDYRSIRTIIDADWTKYIGVYNDIYYYLSRSLTKRININYTPQVTGGCWYAWVKNIGDFRLDDCMVHFHNW